MESLIASLIRRQLMLESAEDERVAKKADELNLQGVRSETESNSLPGALSLAGYLTNKPSMLDYPYQDWWVLDLAVRFYSCAGSSIPATEGLLSCLLVPSRLEFDPINGGAKLGWDWGLRRGEVMGLSLGGTIFWVDWQPDAVAGYEHFSWSGRADLQYSWGDVFFGPFGGVRAPGYSLNRQKLRFSVGASLDYDRKLSLSAGWDLSVNVPVVSFSIGDLDGAFYWLTE